MPQHPEEMPEQLWGRSGKEFSHAIHDFLGLMHPPPWRAHPRPQTLPSGRDGEPFLLLLLHFSHPRCPRDPGAAVGFSNTSAPPKEAATTVSSLSHSHNSSSLRVHFLEHLTESRRIKQELELPGPAPADLGHPTKSSASPSSC